MVPTDAWRPTWGVRESGRRRGTSPGGTRSPQCRALAPHRREAYILGCRGAGAVGPRFFFPNLAMSHDTAELLEAIQQRVANAGFELVDLRVGGSTQRPLLQVRIDRPNSIAGHGVTVDDCAVASRALKAWLDQGDVVRSRYILEVSSPGIERPIRLKHHWKRFIDHDAKVQIPGRGRLRATILRVMDHPDLVVLGLADGGELTVPLTAALDATLAVDEVPLPKGPSRKRKAPSTQ